MKNFGIDIIKELKEKDYKIYLLSNINSHTYNHIKDNKLFNLVDGYVFSYIEHQVKPYVGIYNTLLERYKLIPQECLFIDDNIKNIKTANELGIQGKKVIPDNFESVVQTLKEYNIL